MQVFSRCESRQQVWETNQKTEFLRDWARDPLTGGGGLRKILFGGHSNRITNKRKRKKVATHQRCWCCQLCLWDCTDSDREKKKWSDIKVDQIFLLLYQHVVNVCSVTLNLCETSIKIWLHLSTSPSASPLPSVSKMCAHMTQNLLTGVHILPPSLFL